jgi:hypothetical protein
MSPDRKARVWQQARHVRLARSRAPAPTSVPTPAVTSPAITSVPAIPRPTTAVADLAEAPASVLAFLPDHPNVTPEPPATTTRASSRPGPTTYYCSTTTTTTAATTPTENIMTISPGLSSSTSGPAHSVS